MPDNKNIWTEMNDLQFPKPRMPLKHAYDR